MRKLSYVFTFIAVAFTLVLNVLSARRHDWLVVTSPEVFRSRVTVKYGLTMRCERQVIDIPGPNGGKWTYTDYTCRSFPASVADHCEKENKSFCTSWTSAGYAAEIAIGFAGVSLFTILFGVSTHSRRRRIWKAVAGLVLLHAVFQLVTFGIVTEMYRTSQFPTFEHARPGTAYALNTVSWLVGILVVLGVITTGISADSGHRWAAGNRAYLPIGR